MKNRVVRVSIRFDIMNKASDEQLRRTGYGWENHALTVDELRGHIAKGFPFTHQFANGRRLTENFLGADILIADIDKGMTVDEALEHPFVKDHATFLYTTVSHTALNHRLRIIFLLGRRVVDGEGYKALYESLLNIIPTDPATKSCATLFFGNSKAEFHWIGKIIPDQTITKMISEGMGKRIRASNPLVASTLAPDTLVKVKNKKLLPISVLEKNTSIHCPFETHPDVHASAFIMINQDGIRGVECRSCKHSAWTEKSARPTNFSYFDEMVIKYAGRENSHFEYIGLTKFDHDLEGSMGKSNYHLSNSRQLSLPEILPGINLIKSPKGSGKTHVLSQIIALLKSSEYRQTYGLADVRVVLVGHRRTLIRESAAKLGLECYLDTGDYDTHLDYSTKASPAHPQTTRKPRYYAICLDSLTTRIRLNLEKYDVLIIDESEQVFAHFLSEHMKNPTNNFEILSRVFKTAKYVFCLDADLDTITITGMLSCLSRRGGAEGLSSPLDGTGHLKKLYCHLNTYVPPPQKLELFATEDQLVNDLELSLRAGKKCYVTSNSKRLIQSIFHALSKGFPEKKFELIVSDLGDDLEIKEFLVNIKTEILQLDALYSSPSMGTGIDITFPNDERKIDCVYGFFRGKINTHFDIDQQLGRVRHPGSVKVWVSPRCERLSTDSAKVLQEILYGGKVNGLRYYLDERGAHAEAGDHPFAGLLTEVLIVRRRSMNRLKLNFIRHKEKNGWQIVVVEEDKAAQELGFTILETGNDLRMEANIKRLLSAPDIGFKEVQRIKGLKDSTEPLTEVDKASWEKYWLKIFYDQEVTRELIEFDEEGRTREAIVLLAAVTNPTLKFRHYTEIDTDFGIILGYDGTKIDMPLLQQAVFMREISQAAKVFDAEKFCFIKNATFGIATSADFIDCLQTHEERLARLFNMGLHRHLRTRPTYQFGSLIELMGLTLEQVTKNRGKNKGRATYRIMWDRYTELMTIIERRRKKAEERRISEEIEDKQSKLDWIARKKAQSNAAAADEPPPPADLTSLAF